MNRKELRAFLGGFYCGCGQPEKATETLHATTTTRVGSARACF